MSEHNNIKVRSFFHKVISIIGAYFLIFVSLSGQSISPFSTIQKKLEKDPFKIHGYIQTQLLGNYISGIDRRRDAFNFRINSALTIQSYGWSTSISFNYADKNKVYRFSRPDISLPGYAFIGISPSYKWATFHLGNSNLDFSKYSLSGHSFSGAGIELKPGKWKISGMYGRLRRASVEDFNSLQSLEPSYKRMGWGLKTGYHSNGEHLDLILFSAYDDPLSVSSSTSPDYLTPAENTIFSVLGKKKIGNILTMEIDYAFSSFSRDRTEPIVENQVGINFLERIGGLFQSRISSSYQKAMETKAVFSTAFGNVRLGFERVDPEYRTLGALFFQNDYENITGGSSIGFAQKKIFISTDIGIQRNNVSKKEANSDTRFIGNLNSMWQYSERLNFNASFSNFKSTNKLKGSNLPFTQIDTLVLSLVNQNFNFSANLLSGKNKNQSLLAMISFQKSQAIENDEIIVSQKSTNLMSQVAYTYTYKKKTRLNANIILNKNNGFFSNLTSIIPTVGWSTQLYNDKFKINPSFSMIRLYMDNRTIGNSWQPRIQLSYQKSKRATLKFSASYLSQNQLTVRAQNFNELNTRLEWKIKW